MQEKLFLVLYRFGGVPFTERGYSANKRSMEFWSRNKVNSRNASIPHERAELVRVYEVGVDISAAQADQIEAQNKINKEMQGMPSPEDIDPDFANRVWHEPVLG